MPVKNEKNLHIICHVFVLFPMPANLLKDVHVVHVKRFPPLAYHM